MPKKPKLNEVACPKCKEPIAVDAEICPHCKSVFTADEVASRKKGHAQAKAFGCGAVIMGVLLIAMCSDVEKNRRR
ncbi:zinc ribbon domain-containing protein [Novosphingobium colocasiae]